MGDSGEHQEQFYMRLAQLNRSFDQRVAEAVAQRCAPLVEFAEDVVDLIQGSPDLNLQADRLLKWARHALRAHHAVQSAGRGT
jgi:hypothetical protein